MSPSKSPEDWLADLARASVNLPQEQPPQPYYSQRESNSAGTSELPLASTVRRVDLLVREFHDAHYFAETLGYECVGAGPDEREGSPVPELDRRVGKPHLWLAEAGAWTKSDLCDFIEVFHDLAARPTRRSFHDYDCGWHPEAFSQQSGQALYRWRMNQLLDATTLNLRLAETGEDTGRMVRRVPGELGRLIEDTLSQHTPTDDPVAHAIALFRDRDGARQDRRSAIVALAGVLEERRKLLKDRLLKQDEQALFEIANQYDIRHRNAKQHQDYGLEFLEWIFYWYLATVQLTDRLLDDSTR